MTNEDYSYGIDGASRAMGRGGGPPRLRLKQNERARIHILSNGKDPLFCGCEFHTEGVFPNSNDYVCMRKLSDGKQPCLRCDRGVPRRNKFGVWVYVHNVLRINDNPQTDGDSWPTVTITDGERKRTMFKEELKKALYLELSAGRNWSNYGQFISEYTTHGTLQAKLYELIRVGEGLDTMYLLRAAKDMPLPEAILNDESIMSKLTPVPDLFIAGSNGPVGAAGDDPLGGVDELDVGAGGAAEEEFPVAELPAAAGAESDELI
jgi:hypothetical protein